MMKIMKMLRTNSDKTVKNDENGGIVTYKIL